MGEMDIPSRWDVEVRVMTPDHQVLTVRQTYSPEYMDASLMEYLLRDSSAQITQALKVREYFN